MPSRLSLRQRRMLARGISPRLAKLWANRVFTGDGNRATKSLLAGSSAVAFRAKEVRTPGNSVTVAFVAAGNNTPLSVSVASKAITVNLATNGSAASVSTANDVVRAINNDRNARALVHAYLPQGTTGNGVVTAVGATALTGAV